VREVRQFAVTHTATGLVTLVNHLSWDAGGDIAAAASKAGHRYPVDCEVRRVPRGEETPLPFGEIPLILRKRSRA
jgi:hypothetical protein